MRSNPEIKRERISQAAGVSLRGQVYYCYLHPLSDFQRGDFLFAVIKNVKGKNGYAENSDLWKRRDWKVHDFLQPVSCPGKEGV